jgi:hypothetical protein
MVFNNLYSRLPDLSTPTKPKVSRANIKFNVTQVVDILFQNGFLVDLTFIVLDLEEEDERDTKPTLET